MRVLLLLVTSLGAACVGQNIGPNDAGVTDAGPVTVSCSGPEECPQDTPECAFGVCKRPCAANDGCVDPSTFCSAVSNYCEVGCRDSSTCGDGTVCSGGSCITSQGCGSNCDCDVGQVCANNACAAPPATCNGPDDCPNGPDSCTQYSCNGFSHQCFDQHPTPCTGDADCTGRLGCEGGCTCVTDTGTCSTNVQCTPENENTACGAGFYCGGGTCQAAPSCTSESQCTAAGLTCNLVIGQCERAHACTQSSECTSAPNTFCTTGGHCGEALCNNGGPACSGSQTCTADGRCVTQGTGAPCTSDASCQANEYCAPSGGAGNCAIGCRSNASCTGANQQCDGTHTCVGNGGGGLGGWQSSCTATSDCEAGLFCGSFTHVCQEQCDGSGTGQCAVDGCCQLSGAPCCQALLIPVCSASGC